MPEEVAAVSLSQGWVSTGKPFCPDADEGGPCTTWLSVLRFRSCSHPELAVGIYFATVFYLTSFRKTQEQVLILSTIYPCPGWEQRRFFVSLFRCIPWLLTQWKLQPAAHNNDGSSEHLFLQQNTSNQTHWSSSSPFGKQISYLHFPRDQSFSATSLCFLQKKTTYKP